MFLQVPTIFPKKGVRKASTDFITDGAVVRFKIFIDFVIMFGIKVFSFCVLSLYLMFLQKNVKENPLGIRSKRRVKTRVSKYKPDELKAMGVEAARYAAL